jgi:predicted lipoprotein with Yx(FWY)xxD motif
MRQITKLFPVLGVSLLVAACGSSSGSTSSSSTAAAAAPPPTPSSGAQVVKTASVSPIGASVLVDSKGLTLYHLSGEQNGKWICTSSACVKAWHPLTVATGSAPTGSVSSLGAAKRPDGTRQITFKGMPLYTFIGDTKPGDAKGQGIKDVGVWTAVTAHAASSAKPATPASSSSSSAAGGGYAY